MKRRSFLKIIAGLFAAPVVPALSASAPALMPVLMLTPAPVPSTNAYYLLSDDGVNWRAFPNNDSFGDCGPMFSAHYSQELTT